MDQPTIKIFISSPGDVLYERQIAKRIIAKLGKEFVASAKLEALLWEDMPLQVTASFQEGIDQIVNANLVDIAIFILWSRMGTPLDGKFLKADGSRYKSGTEYEFEIMYAANQQSGTPSILAYIKNAPIADAIFQSSANADFDIEEIGRQHKEAQRFIREKFYDPQTKTVYGAYHQFEAPTTFEQKLTEHLRRLIINKIGHEAVPIEWEGNPYVGLRSFRYDENAIFYGRRHTINVIEEKLNRWLPDKAPCLFVLGESGSGKSSLVRAGLLPDMIEFGWVENTKWKWFDLMPNQFRGNVYNGILSKLGEAFPVLNEKAIGKDLLTGKEVNFGHLADILPDTTNEAVLFFIDQFEEIFTDPLITEEERARTFTLLRGIASTHKVWMFFSMRNDFYHRFTAYPILWELKNESIVCDLPKILHSELQEIIEEPAKKAGLKWETNEQAIPLNKTIIHDVSAGVDDLPLIEFALSELYHLRNENNVLTYKAYEDIGKINGAVVKYVDNFYNTLSNKEKEIFSQILSALIAPSKENKKLYVRKTALLKDLQKTELHRKLIKSLIDSHILISGKDENEEPTLSIVHEILIVSWNVIQDWIKQEKYFIDANNHYENLSKYWLEHNKSKNDLLRGAVAMKECEYFLYSWENNCSATVKDFLFTSIKRKKRMSLPWVLFFLLNAGIACLVLFLKYLSNDKADFSSDGLLINFNVFVLLLFAAWKKIKAVPEFRTINISLSFWSLFFVLSIVFNLVCNWLELWIICVVLLPKVALTIVEKREILQWKHRIFKRRFNFFSNFLDNTSESFQKMLRTIVWGVSVLLVASICVGVPYLIYLVKDVRNFDKTYRTIDGLFSRFHGMTALDNTSSPLPVSDRIFINRQRATYLRDNYFERKVHIYAKNTDYGKWSASRRYFDYAIIQYRLGYPEDFLTGIQDCLKSNSLEGSPLLTINAAFELGLFDECRQLLELQKNNTENSKWHYFNHQTIWTAAKVGSFDLVVHIIDSLRISPDLTEGEASPDPSKGGELDGGLQIYKAHALLMTGEREKALPLYRSQINDRKDAIEKDFAVFRWLGFPDTEISMIEKELNLNRISVYTHPDNDANTVLAQTFTGNWQYEGNDSRINLEITKDNHNLCRYLFQTKKGDKEWVDDDIAVTRYRFKQMADKTIMEEYNVRSNVISVNIIALANDDELHIKAIGDDEIKIYRKVK